MRWKLALPFCYGLVVSSILYYFNRVGFEWLPFGIIILIVYSVYIEIKYID